MYSQFYVRVSGGFSNQLLQLSLALYLSERARVSLDISDFTYYDIHSGFIGLTGLRSQRISSIRSFSKLFGKILSRASTILPARSFAFFHDYRAISYDMSTCRSPLAYFNGTWMSPVFYGHNGCFKLSCLLSDIIANMYEATDPLALSADLKSNPLLSSSALVHLRQGDYAVGRYRSLLYLLHFTDYYDKALARARALGVDRVYLISDAPLETYLSLFPDRFRDFFVIDTGQMDSISILRLMVNCGVLIGANSSLSWIASLLRAGGSFSMLPKRWFFEGQWCNTSHVHHKASFV